MKALITNIQGLSIHDGPGIRTVVFFKGCSLACKWCANPECISPRAQIGFVRNLCAQCLRCLQACPENAIAFGGDVHRVDYGRCTSCGKCVDACPYKALVRYGVSMDVREVFESVRRDRMFFDASGGGVTVSGGEPLLEAPFVAALFELCKAEGIDTCLETSGCAPSERLLSVLPAADHVLFDLKHMDPEVHERYTGKPNGEILENARLAVEKGADVLFRVPLIPSVNDDPENIERTAAFVKSLECRPRVELMPYHRLGDGKYRALNLKNPMEGVKVMTPEEVEAVRQAYAALGVECSVSR